MVPPSNDRDRAILAYNPLTDPCTDLNAFSHQEEKDTADWACKEAFLALDRIGGNSCNGYRQPKCRFFLSSLRRECSCLISICSHLLVVNDVAKPFRECALDFWTEELHVGQVATSTRFQETLKQIERDALQAARARTPYYILDVPGSSGAGTSYGTNTHCGEITPLIAPVKHDKGAVKPGAGGKAFVCKTCGHGYTSVKALRNHEKSHKEDLTCQICKRGYSSRTNFHSHIRKTHMGKKAAALSGDVAENQALVDAYEASKPHVCDQCGKRFKWNKSLMDHKEMHKLDSTTCKLCGKTLSTPSNLRTHLKNQHPGQKSQ